jgi:Fe2+ or Zn2+ uptake regulation protein
MTSAEKLIWALSFCQKAQLRVTARRKKILHILSAYRLPVSIEMIVKAESDAAHCAETTVYRTLILFREVDLVRQINLPGKISHFILNVPDKPSDFLVCRCCGRVEELAAPKAILELEQDVAKQSGFKAVYHELELYGVCPDCQTAGRNATPPTKLASLNRPFVRPD